jgi:hypothetical protein
MCSPGVSARDQVLSEFSRLTSLAIPDATPADPDTLMAQIRDLCAFIDQLDGQLARLAAALDTVGGPINAGHGSVAAFLRNECGRAPGRAAGLAALGRGLSRLPVTGKTLAAGEISADAALVIARATAVIQDNATAGQAEQILVEAAARGLGISQLRQLGEEVAYRADPDTADERARRMWERRHLSFGLTFGAGVVSGACGDAMSLEIVQTASEAFAPPGGACDTRTAAQRRMDGLVAACKTALDTGQAPIRHGTAPHISILVRDETLAQALGAPPARTGHGTMLTARQVLALCCGARLTAIRWEDGLPLDVGRTARTESPAIRRALEARDLTCRWPGCDTPGLWCTGHHIGGWRGGANTCLAEMVLLCHLHHTYFIHLLGWTITGDPNQTLQFHHPAGITALHSPLPGRARAP